MSSVLPRLAFRIPLVMDAAAAHTARTVVRDVLRGWGVPSGAVDDAVLAVSELVANVVLHARTPGELEIEMGETRSWLRLVVIDGSSTPPMARLADGNAESGRGLAILAALSDRWGIEADGPGKRVWVEIDLQRVGVPPVYVGSATS